ncbi:hypothetical protein GWI33_018574 [Rhynchophorus ferrugineus]|uniref:Uncharacterized protein n=1 Tax=Rhynchophorus ferrugineus TaxID=354439 RepID=A0A834HW40_RHYFE|nr:hypothetical protein GWI33_018574 [Rhynchophorus ferrugineus]
MSIEDGERTGRPKEIELGHRIYKEVLIDIEGQGSAFTESSTPNCLHISVEQTLIKQIMKVPSTIGA